MPKIVYYLSFLFIFLNLFFLFSPDTILASQRGSASFQGKSLTITYDPDPLTTFSSNITVTVEGDKEVFVNGQKYFYTIWADGKDEMSCGLTSGAVFISPALIVLGKDKYRNMGEVTGSDPKKIVISWDPSITGCPKINGDWNFRLWTGKEPSFTSDPAPSSNSILINQSQFRVDRPGGSFSQIKPVKPADQNFLSPQETPKVKLINGRKGETYYFFWEGAVGGASNIVFVPTFNAIATQVTADFDGDRVVELSRNGGSFAPGSKPTVCVVRSSSSIASWAVFPKCNPDPNQKVQFQVPIGPVEETAKCSATVNPVYTTVTDRFLASISGSNIVNGPSDGLLRGDLIASSGKLTRYPASTSASDQIKINQGVFLINLGEVPAGDYQFNVYGLNSVSDPPICSVSLDVNSIAATNAAPNRGSVCRGEAGTDPETCAKASGIACNPKDGNKINLDSKNPGILTAVGCISTEPKAFVEGILKFVSFAAGGVALILMILAALQMITAEGNPEYIKQAQEKFYSAIIGLLFIIFSVLLLQVIGYDVLGLPGFGR